MSTSGTTADRILDIAYELITRRGYGGFSFADIAKELSITKPAIHYHYPSKADLVVATTQRHRRLFALALDDITAVATTADDRLHGYVELFARQLEGGRMSLCGMLAAEIDIVPEPVRAEITAFFDDNVRWLAQSMRVNGSPTGADRTRAAALFAGLEGAILVARVDGGVDHFRAIAALLRNV